MFSQNGIVQTPSQFMMGLAASPGTAGILLANNFNVGALRTHSTTLRQDEWKTIDDALVRVARQKLNMVADLQGAGLTKPNGGLGTLIHEYDKIGGFTDASIAMRPEVSAEFDSLTYDRTGVPVPIISKPFYLDARRLAASRKNGTALDTEGIEAATRTVIEAGENLVCNGNSTIKMDGRTIPGYTTFSDRNTGSGLSWATPANIITDVLNMIAAAEADNHYGPFVLYVNNVDMANMRNPLDTVNYTMTALKYIEGMPQISAVKSAAKLATNQRLLVELSSDVVDLSVGQDLMVIPWTEMGGFIFVYLVIMVMAPRIKSDAEGQCGIVHYTYTA